MIDMTAIIPPFMMLPFKAFSGEALNTIMVSPAVAIMRIMITIPIVT